MLIILGDEQKERLYEAINETVKDRLKISLDD